MKADMDKLKVWLIEEEDDLQEEPEESMELPESGDALTLERKTPEVNPSVPLSALNSSVSGKDGSHR